MMEHFICNLQSFLYILSTVPMQVWLQTIVKLQAGITFDQRGTFLISKQYRISDDIV